LLLRLSVPATGDLRGLATEMASRVAAFLGSSTPDADTAGRTLEGLAARVAPAGVEEDITFEFRQAGGELLIEARCQDRASEARWPLPA
jgi:hypothetical protein